MYSCPASPPARPVPSAQRSFPHQDQRGPSTLRPGRGPFFSAGRPPGARGPLGAAAPRAGPSPSCSPVVGSSRVPCPGCPVALDPAPTKRVKPGGNKPICVPGPAGPSTPLSQPPLVPGPRVVLGQRAPRTGRPRPSRGSRASPVPAGQCPAAAGSRLWSWPLAPFDLMVTGSARPACERPLLGLKPRPAAPPPTRAPPSVLGLPFSKVGTWEK